MALKLGGVGGWGVIGEGVCGYFHFWEFFKEPDKVAPGIELTTATAFDEGIPDGVALSGLFAPHEEPVLFSDSGRPNPIFDQVIIDL